MAWRPLRGALRARPARQWPPSVVGGGAGRRAAAAAWPAWRQGAAAVAAASRGVAMSAAASDEAILNEMKLFAVKQQTSVSMRTLLDTGHGLTLEAPLNMTEDDVCAAKGLTKHQHTLMQIATFLQRELPIRYAHRARELDNLPEGLYHMPSIQMVKHWYTERNFNATYIYKCDLFTKTGSGQT